MIFIVGSVPTLITNGWWWCVIRLYQVFCGPSLFFVYLLSVAILSNVKWKGSYKCLVFFQG